MFHEADSIHEDNVFSTDPEVRRWVAVHKGCGGTLSIVADDWSCDACGATFHDHHCADLVAERRDRAAREAASLTWADDEKGSAKKLDKARASIRKELLGKRASRDADQAAHEARLAAAAEEAAAKAAELAQAETDRLAAEAEAAAAATIPADPAPDAAAPAPVAPPAPAVLTAGAEAFEGRAPLTLERASGDHVSVDGTFTPAEALAFLDRNGHVGVEVHVTDAGGSPALVAKPVAPEAAPPSPTPSPVPIPVVDDAPVVVEPDERKPYEAPAIVGETTLAAPAFEADHVAPDATEDPVTSPGAAELDGHSDAHEHEREREHEDKPEDA